MNTKGKVAFLWKLAKEYRSLYIGAMVSVTLATLVGFLPPLVVGATVDNIIGGKALDAPAWILRGIESLGGTSTLAQNLWICGLILILLTAVSGLFTYFKGKWSAEAAEGIAKNIRDRAYDHLQRLPFSYHKHAQTGDLIQRCTSDVETIRRFLAVQVVELGRIVLIAVFAVSIMLTLDVGMALVSLISVPLVFVWSMVFFGRIQKVFTKVDESEGRLSNVIQENLTGIRVVRAFATQGHEYDKFIGKNREFRDLVLDLINLFAWYWALTHFLVFMEEGAVLVYGAYRAASGTLSLGSLIVFMFYVGMLLWPVRQLGQIVSDMGRASVSVGRIREILNEELEPPEPQAQKPEIKGSIRFDHVSFGYEDGEDVLHDVSFSVEPGQTVAILGATGSGKSSLVHLLQRLYDYDEGSITVDGIELRDIDRQWIRKHIGLILQEPFLFSRTIRENIALSAIDAPDHIVHEAAQIASIHDVILEFEDGYQTAVGEKGVTLSGGQKQRVAIARTLINETPVLVFDDSLSAVDTETDAAIRQALKKRSRDVTTFIISHRINTIREADLILVMEHGRIKQKGTHAALIEQSGLYREIWEMQTEAAGA
jgi:ATP-binding cassette subfamily B protein